MAREEFVQRRLIAWLIDGLLVVALWKAVDHVGVIVGVVYWLLRDGLFEGQSIGKRLMELKVIVVKPRHARCTFKHSIIRNVLWVVPVVNVVMALSGLYYFYFTTDRDSRHWGDRLADTTVVTV